MTLKSHGLLDQVDDLIKHAKTVMSNVNIPSNEGTFIQAQLVRHGCVLTCAAMEQALIESIEGYAARVGDNRLKEFIGEILKTGKNPFPDYIKSTLGRLDAKWGSEIEIFMTDKVGTDIIKSVVSNRNRIAHGESVSMGLTSLLQWIGPVRTLCLEITSKVSSATPVYGPMARKPRRGKRQA